MRPEDVDAAGEFDGLPGELAMNDLRDALRAAVGLARSARLSKGAIEMALQGHSQPRSHEGRSVELAVCVDDMQASFGRMKMCHMMADTTDELLAMADQIGVARKWIQKAGTDYEHFDIAMSKRTLAVKHVTA